MRSAWLVLLLAVGACNNGGGDVAPTPGSAPTPAAPGDGAWSDYETTVQTGEGDTRIAIRVDLSAAKAQPDASRPRLLLLIVNMIDPSEDGITDRSSDSQLDAIATAIQDELAPALEGRYVGRARRNGADEHYVYVPANADLATAHESLERRFAAHGWLAMPQEDADWTVYRELLLPGKNDNK